MNTTDRAVVDFETEAIASRPNYPPKPAGVSIKMPGAKPTYYAWGHPEGNNCDISTARSRVRDAYLCKRTVFHNGNFDMDVGQSFLGLAPPERYDDTVFLAFLNNPYERSLELKPLGEKHLGLAPEEQTALKDWIIENVPEAKRKKSEWGGYISRAPVSLVRPYANGDVHRTDGLFEKLYPIVTDRGMGPAYERELSVLPITLEMERSGVRVDRKRLKEALVVFEKMDKDIVLRIQRKLGVARGYSINEDFNVDSGPQLAKALVAAGKLDAIIKTATGKVSTKITNLRATCNDKELLDLLAVHSVCSTYAGTFIRPWLLQSAITGGRILPRFNQTRNDGGGGARSGRFSSSNPNLQNIPTNPEESQNKDTLLLLQKWLLDEYSFQFFGLRDYILPDEGCEMVCVDYDQQELRILAHFEDDVLAEAYRKNPKMDIHDFCRLLIKDAIGIDFPRKHIKVTVFGIVYGMGLEKLAARLEIDKATAKKLRDAIFNVIPGIERLMKELKYLANKDEPLETWGGREYFCEEPKRIKETDANTGKEYWKWISFEYKMLNYLIQPSAADVTKQGMINVREQVPQARIAIQVHDELVCMVRNRKYGPRIAEAMCDMKFKIPMSATPKYSTTSWARAAA